MLLHYFGNDNVLYFPLDISDRNLYKTFHLNNIHLHLHTIPNYIKYKSVVIGS